MIRVLLAASLAVAAIGPTAAQSSQPAAPATADQPTTEKKVCRRQIGTGSIMPKRVCKTKAEWAAIDPRQDGLGDVVRNRQETSTLTGAHVNGN
jgi:hypothetical protein